MEVDGFEGEEFHPSIEPMVIINSQEDEEEHPNSRGPLGPNPYQAYSNDPSFKKPQGEEEILSNIGPEVTLYSVKKKRKPAFKIRLFGNHYSGRDKEDIFNEEQEEAEKRNGKIIPHRKAPSIRTPVRLISQEEAMMAEEPYAKRKSNPLEKCPICKKYFRRMKTHLAKHEILENQSLCSGLICMICNKAFNNHTNLQIHMRTHTGDKPYMCEVCNKSFSQSCNLVNHMRIHTGEKPFKCPHCDRAFTQSGNLNNHIRLHTDEKPFKCHFCDKAFVQSGNLNSHIRNNHRVKPFSRQQPEVVNG
ncbi:zinc finger protein 22-like [Anthonomus grandis grandis]|uniref:zinc finger protein 22-like n=1 Tax=Anthonomus grandis grandis TaxID=2921223 RepID=UPI0021654626|nr:zinc finger protein 22-like [Anthonomus grandis grandis]